MCRARRWRGPPSSAPVSVLAAAKHKGRGVGQASANDRILMLTVLASLMSGVAIEQKTWERLCIWLAGTMGDTILDVSEVIPSENGSSTADSEEYGDDKVDNKSKTT